MENVHIGTFAGAQTAWWNAIRAVELTGCDVGSVRDSTSVGSSFGKQERPFRELHPATFTITNPRQRLLVSKVRRMNLAFALANFIWTVSGSNRVDTISQYNRNGLRFSDDGVTLASALGPKLFGPSRQFDRVADILRRDRTSRRGVIDLFDLEAAQRGSRDVSCALAMQFLVRNDRLDCIVYMRSQSVVMVLPYDVFLFTMLQEAMACALKLPIGNYHHMSGSFHYYVDEARLATEVMLEGEMRDSKPMPPMLSFDEHIRSKIVDAEREARPLFGSDNKSSSELVRSLLPRYEFDHYWQAIFGALIHAHVVAKT